MPLGLALYPYIPRPPCITKATSRCLKSLFLSQSPPPLPTCPHLQHQRVIFSSCFTPSSDLAAQRPAGLRSPSPETQQWCCQVSLRVLGEIFSRPHWPHTYTQGALLQETQQRCVWQEKSSDKWQEKWQEKGAKRSVAGDEMASTLLLSCNLSKELRDKSLLSSNAFLKMAVWAQICNFHSLSSAELLSIPYPAVSSKHTVD